MKLKLGQRFKLKTDGGFDIYGLVVEDNEQHRSYWVQDIRDEDDYWHQANMRWISYDLIERFKDSLVLLTEGKIEITCTCGSATVGHPGHTWYCDLYGKN